MSLLSDKEAAQRSKSEPKFSYRSDGATGVISTAPMSDDRNVHDPHVWDDMIVEAGLDPETVRVIPPVQVRMWDAAIGAGKVQRMRYFKINVEHCTPGLDITALVDRAKRSAFVPKRATGEEAFVVALGDLQLGKALADSTPVPTPAGWMRHGDLRPGMRVYSPVTGMPVPVLDNTGSTEQRLYRVSFADGTSLVATYGHEFLGYEDADDEHQVRVTVQEMERMLLRGQLFRLIRTAPLNLLSYDTVPEGVEAVRDPLDSLVGDRFWREEVLQRWYSDLDSRVPTGLAPEAYTAQLSEKHHYLLQAARIQGWRPYVTSSFPVDEIGPRGEAVALDAVGEGVLTPYSAPRPMARTTVAQMFLDLKFDQEEAPHGLSVVGVDYIGTGMAQCITVQGGMYLAGDYIPTHNCDGDGVEGTVQRFVDKTAAVVTRYLSTSRGKTVYVVHLGDCIEGFVSQGGANTYRTTLTTTEQVDLYQQITLEQIKAFADVAPEVVVVGVPGNHDEAVRPLQSYTDSWAVQAMKTLERALHPDLNPNFGHVSFRYPERDELVVVLDIAGLKVAAAHGHKFPRGAEGFNKWWQGQTFGRQPAAEASLLLAGHKHHLMITEPTAGRMFIQVPALESDSAWFRHQTGIQGKPGVVTFQVTDGGLHSIEVL